MGLNVGNHSGVQVEETTTSIEITNFDPQGSYAQASKLGLNAGSGDMDGKAKTIISNIWKGP